VIDLAIALLPALLLLAALVAGLYPGESRLDRVRRRLRTGMRVAAPSCHSMPTAPERAGPRGATLLAFSMAGRAPPATAGRLART
jgi:hypothetical protein